VVVPQRSEARPPAAIFQFAPSPFCILDEANVGRFTDLIKEMSIKTQFVVITHSKRP